MCDVASRLRSISHVRYELIHRGASKGHYRRGCSPIKSLSPPPWISPNAALDCYIVQWLCSSVYFVVRFLLIIIIIIIISTKIFVVLSSWQSHCESSLGSRDEYRNGARWPPTFAPSQSACAADPPIYRQPVNRIHHRHLLLLLSPKADTHFSVPQRVEG